MKIRIVSDLHLSMNEKYHPEIKKDDIYTLIAGDLGPEFKKNAEWIRNNISKGAFISGNHDAYTHDNTPIEDVKEFYHKEFPFDSDITYFDSDVGVLSKNIDDKTILVSDVLYTDFTYPCFDYDSELSGVKELQERNMRRVTPKMSGSYMNDFMFFTKNGKYSHCNNGSCRNGLHYIRPEMYVDHFESALSKITEIIERNTDKDIVLMTHHCLSPKCQTPSFDHRELNSAYITDKEDWILKHPNIKLIVSGHIHNVRDFKIGNTLYVMNPLGYCKEGHYITTDKDGKKTYWTPNLFVDTDDWTIERGEDNPYNNEWDSKSKAYLEELLKYSSAFF